MATCSTTPSLRCPCQLPSPLISFSQQQLGYRMIIALQKCSQEGNSGQRRRHLKSQVSWEWRLLVVAFKGYRNSQPQFNICKIGLNHFTSQDFSGMERTPWEWPAQSMQSILALCSFPHLQWTHHIDLLWEWNQTPLLYLTFCQEKSFFINSHCPTNTSSKLFSSGGETQQRCLAIIWRLIMYAWYVCYNSLLNRKFN